MSELWIVLPPQRREPEVTLTVIIAVASSIHVFPLIAADPEPGIEMVVDEGPCFFPAGDSIEEPYFADEDVYGPLLVDDSRYPALARQQAIEQARVGGIGSFAIEHDHDSTEPCVLDDFGSRFEPLTAPTRQPRQPSFADQFALDLAGPPIAIAVLTTGDKQMIRRSLKRAVELARCDHTRLSLRLGADRVDDGAVGVTFTIERDGRLTRIITDDTGPTSACVAQVLKTIELPKANEPTPVRATLRYGTTERSAGVLVR